MQLFQQFGVRWCEGYSLLGHVFHRQLDGKGFYFSSKKSFLCLDGAFFKKKIPLTSTFFFEPKPLNQGFPRPKGDGKQFPSSLLKRVDMIFWVDVIFFTRDPKKGRAITPKYFLVQPNK